MHVNRGTITAQRCALRATTGTYSRWHNKANILSFVRHRRVSSQTSEAFRFFARTHHLNANNGMACLLIRPYWEKNTLTAKRKTWPSLLTRASGPCLDLLTGGVRIIKDDSSFIKAHRNYLRCFSCPITIQVYARDFICTDLCLLNRFSVYCEANSN